MVVEVSVSDLNLTTKQDNSEPKWRVGIWFLYRIIFGNG